MFSKTIRKAVMAAIESKIKEVELEHEAHCKTLDEECEKNKLEAFETRVKTLISKII